MRIFIISLAFLTFTPVAFAQCVPTQANDYCIGQPGTTVNNTGNGQSVGTNYTSPGVQLINPLQSGSSLSGFLQQILAFVIRIGAVVVILMLVYVGFKFVTAQGNETKISEAKGMLLWTVIGALILLGAQVIATGIQATVQSLGG